MSITAPWVLQEFLFLLLDSIHLAIVEANKTDIHDKLKYITGYATPVVFVVFFKVVYRRRPQHFTSLFCGFVSFVRTATRPAIWTTTS
jgi:hypothetical protein